MEPVKTATPVSQIMTTKIHKVTTNNSLSDVKWLFDNYHIRHAPVVNGEVLIGIISLTDLQRLRFAHTLQDNGNVDTAFEELLSVEQVMKHDPVTVTQNNTLEDVAKILTREEFHALPVVDEDKKLVGIITTTDIIKLLLDEDF